MKAWRRIKVTLEPIMPIEDMNTVLMPITDPYIAIGDVWIDDQLRHCLKLQDSTLATPEMVSYACILFYNRTGMYPNEIVLCPLRYLLYHGQSYNVNGMISIPFTYEENSTYDVLVRRRCY